MLLKIIENIKEKFKNSKNLFSLTLEKREEYYKEIEIFQDAYNFYKTHSEEKTFSLEEEIEIVDFFKFCFNLGDFLTPLNFKDLLIFFKNKENQIEFSFLLLECSYFFEDNKIFENLLNYLEKNFEYLKDEKKFKFLIKKGLFYLILKDSKNFEKSLQKAMGFNYNIDEFSKKQIKNQLLIYPLEIKEEIKNLLNLNGKEIDMSLEEILTNYSSSLKEGNYLQEKFYRNLLNKHLKEDPLNFEGLNLLADFLSKIDTYFLNNHNKEVRDMTMKIYEKGKAIWDKNIDGEKIERGSYFHDLGKLSLPWILMDRKITLNEKEKEKFKYHSQFTYEILKKAGLEEEAIFALDHHKYINGKGYPDDSIKPSFEGNIICLSESFIGAVNLSSQSKIRQKEELFIELKQLRGIYFYPEIVDALLLLE